MKLPFARLRTTYTFFATTLALAVCLPVAGAQEKVDGIAGLDAPEAADFATFKRIAKIQIPKIEAKGVPVVQFLRDLEAASIKADTEGKGIPVEFAPGAEAALKDLKVTFRAEKIAAADAMESGAILGGASASVKKGRLVVTGVWKLDLPPGAPPISKERMEVIRILSGIRLEKIAFKETTLTGAVLELEDAVRKSGHAPENFQIVLPPELDMQNVKLTLTLNRVPALEVIKYLTNLSNLNYAIEPNGVRIKEL
jgi:hypothetical protein